MKQQLDELFPYEFEDLLNALQRDLRSQQSFSSSNKEWAQWHLSNARMVCRLLEYLTPKSSESVNGRHAFASINCADELGCAVA